MGSCLRKCHPCERYTLLLECATYGAITSCPVPPKYHSGDRMDEYRRRTIIERYGENGKLDKL